MQGKKDTYFHSFRILPTKVSFIINRFCGAYNLMDTFKGRSQKND